MESSYLLRCILYGSWEVNLYLVWPARPLPPLQIIILSFIVEGKGLATLAAFLVQLGNTHIQVCGHCGRVVDVLSKHYKVRCITCSLLAIVTVCNKVNLLPHVA